VNHLLLDAHGAPGTPAASKAAFYLSSADGFLHCKFASGNDIIVAADDAWQAFSVQGYQNSWLDGGEAAAQFKLVQDKTVICSGSLKAPAGVVNGQVIVNVPAAYRPASTQLAATGVNRTAANAVAFTIGSAGNFAFRNMSAAPALNDDINFQGAWYLDL